MRIIILTQYYPPETGAPQNRLSDLARRLREMDHYVQVITALPNYPLGHIFPEYRGHLIRRGILDGISIIYCWLYPSHSRSIFLRLFSYFSFVISSALVGALFLSNADIILAESPPLFLGLSAWWLAKIKRAKLVLNISDLYPDTAISLGYLNNHLLQKIFYAFEAWCYHQSILVTGQTRGIIDNIHRRFPSQPVYLLTNGVDLSQFECQLYKSARQHSDLILDQETTFNIGYAGILGHAQKLETILDAAAQLLEHSGIQFHFYGDGPMRDSLIEKAFQMGLSNVHFRGHRSHPEVLNEMRTWHAGIVPLVDSKLMAGALPSKMFEIMASGIPVILSAPKGEASTLIEFAQAGVWVPAERPGLLAKEIINLANNPALCKQFGKNGQNYVSKYYDRKQIAQQFVAYLINTGIVQSG